MKTIGKQGSAGREGIVQRCSFQEDNDICSCSGGGRNEDNLCKGQGCEF